MISSIQKAPMRVRAAGGSVTGGWIALLAILTATIGHSDAASGVSSQSMNPNLKHHVVALPDCQIRFSYPADLKPSPDFVMDHMDTSASYDTRTWWTKHASEPFINMNSDLRDGWRNKVYASVSISMWLCVAQDEFKGDVRNPEDLHAAFNAICIAEPEGESPDAPEERNLSGRTWLYYPKISLNVTGLNSRYMLCFRVRKKAEESRLDDAIGWITRVNEAVYDSIRIEPLAVPTRKPPASLAR